MEETDSTKPDVKRLATFSLSEAKHKKFKEICAREGVAMGDKIDEFMQKYIEVHGEGNPIYSLDKYADPDFKMTPAFFESLQTKWKPFFEKCSKDELQEIIDRGDGLARQAKKFLYP